VAKSHERKPRPVLRMQRISDEELRQHYPEESFKEFTGSAGFILIEDTRGFHKGKPLSAGDRLMFEVIYATSHFGANYDRVQLRRDEIGPELRDAMRRFPEAYHNIEAA
jgi:hypothetical protein